MTEEKRCPGCGALFQSVNPQEKGYIPAEVLGRGDEVLCARCFSLVHYHRDCPLPFEAARYQALLATIARSRALVVAVVDLFDLEGTFLTDLNRWFPSSPLLLIANKADLFPRETKREKLMTYLERTCARQGVKASASLVATANSHDDAPAILAAIERLRRTSPAPDDVYFIGRTNVGKSSLLKMLSYAAKMPAPSLTVSDMVSTTQDLITIPMPSGVRFHDTPGLLNPSSANTYLTKASLDKVVPKKAVHPAVLQWFGTSTLFIGGFARVTIAANEASVVAYFARPVVLHRTKAVHAEEFYQEHKDDLLLIPTEEERNKLGALDKSVTVKVREKEKTDIAFAGLGFLTIKGDATVTVVTFMPLGVSVRPALI